MVFAEDWGAETGSFPDDATIFPEPELAGDTHVQAVPSGPGRRNQAFRNLVLSAINEADEHVTMVTPYFMPDAPSLLALKLRAMAGVRVDIIVPEKTNSVLVNAAAKSAFLELLRVGASVHLHRAGLLHVKAVTIDDKVAIFGSGNFDRRSFNLNYELNLLTLGPNVAFRLRNLLETYQKDSRPLTIEELESRSRVAQITSDVAKLVAPLL
jgi:cardiolipin synthase